ncbi:MAG: NfeD family protein [Prevotellaceae bacterium]|nr:NfeD family protein [Prevotellaceae bacterium]MDY3366006.1 NfeD family protein [Prevotella sp.]
MDDFLFFDLWILWLIVSLLCLIIELLSGTLYILCLAIGSLIACLSSFLGIPFEWQILVFALASLASVFLIRPLALSFLHRGEDKRKSNVDALIGKQGVVIETIEQDGSGYIKVDGDEWKAVSIDGLDIPKGTKVQIVRMDSIIATVTIV